MEEKINVNEVELAERYAAALKEIADLTESIEFNKDDVKAAVEYAEALKKIEGFDQTWSENDVKEAHEYLDTLKEIEETKEEKT